LRHFRDQGVAIVLISHKLAEVAAVADRITVLRRGEVTLTGSAGEFDAVALSRAMIGHEAALERRDPRSASPSVAQREVRVELRGLSLHAGEIVGIAAVEGNGQRELMRA